MLGRGVAERLQAAPEHQLFSDEVIVTAQEADLTILNLECCVSTRGSRWPDPAKPFYFRAPPEALAHLRMLGVRLVTLANNHALDFGRDALLDTFEHLRAASIAWVGAGPDRARARAPHVLEAGGIRIGVIGLTDHPAEYSAEDDRAGVAFAPLSDDPLPNWVAEAIARARADAELVLVTPHWGPNMTERPEPHVRRAGSALLAGGASLVAGHSAHVFHGIEGPILWDLGDFVDDYAVDPDLRNDLGLLWLVDLDRRGPLAAQAVPLRLEYCHTRLARGHEREWVAARLDAACAELGTAVEERSGRLLIPLR